MMCRFIPFLRSARILALVGAVLFLVAACAPMAPRNSVSLLGGQFILAAPPGFCVDPNSRRDGKGGSFVMLADCAVLAGGVTNLPPARAVMLSATIGPESAGPIAVTFPGFERFFHSKEGRAALSRSGAAGDVSVLASRKMDQALFLKIRDASAVPATSFNPVHWRAIVELGGRITALSVLSPANSAPADAQQIKLLRDFIAAIRSANHWTN